MKPVRSIKRYLPFAKASWMSALAYKMHILLWILSDAMSAFLMCLLWIAVYRAHPTGMDSIIHGFSLIDMIQYTLMARLTAQLVGSSESFWSLSDDIRSGNISMTLMKPISYRLKNLFAAMGSFGFSFVLFILPMLIFLFAIMGQFGGQIPNIGQALMFLLTVFLGAVIVDSIDFLFGMSSIFTGALFGLGQIKSIVYNFLSGAVIPIVFFPSLLQKIVAFLPYGSVLSTPIQIILGKIDSGMYLEILMTQIAWILVLNLLCKVLFDRFIKHVIVVGG